MIVHPKAYLHMQKHDPPVLDCDECWQAWGISPELRKELQITLVKPDEKTLPDDVLLKRKAP